MVYKWDSTDPDPWDMPRSRKGNNAIIEQVWVIDKSPFLAQNET